jgi:hypothetical protein
MPSLITKDTSGSDVTIANSDKITGLDGETYELYVIDVIPMGHYTQTAIKPRLIHPIDVTIETFSTFTGLVPTFNSAVTVKGQVRWKKAQEANKDKGPSATVSDGHIVFEHKPAGQRSKLFKAVFLDKSQGFIFANRFTVQLYGAKTGGDSRRGKPGTLPAPTALTVEYVDPVDQYEYSGGTRVKVGDAKIRVARDLISKTAIEDASKFGISVDGGTEESYTIVSQSGVRALQSYHWDIFLQRLKG